jgi:uncharacterized UPF0160 family protein
MDQSTFYFVTHDMGFHTDEVLAYSIFSYTFKDKYKIELIRTRRYDLYEKENHILVDIGYKYIKNKFYDHHQNDNNGYLSRKENGIKYSSAGLIWKDFGEEYIKLFLKEKNINNVYDLDILDIFYEIDKKFITHIDLVDNGKFQAIPYNTSIITIDKMFYPPQNNKTEETYLEGFIKYSNFLNDYLKMLIDTAYKRVGDRNILLNLYDGHSEYLILEGLLLWKKAVTNDDSFKNLKFVINKMEDNTWRINPIQSSRIPNKFKINLPQQWLGLSDEKFKEVTGIEDVIFCHSAGFTAGAKSKEACIKLYELIIK